MFLEFEWDDSKAEANFKKHHIRLSEAVSVWLDGAALEILDPDHGHHEERWIRMGLSSSARLLVVVYVEKIEGERIRVISARRAVRSEELVYER